MSSLEPIFKELAMDSVLGSSRTATAERLAYYFGEINAVHPFREGNGRAICQFIYDLPYDKGFIMNWGMVSAGELDAAAAQAMFKPPELLTGLFMAGVVENSPNQVRIPAVVKPRSPRQR